MKELDELEALITLTMTPHLGSIKIRLLIQYFGSATEAMRADFSEVAGLPGFGDKTLVSLQQSKQSHSAMKEMELAARFHADIIPYTDSRYPRRLLEIPDYPLILYVKGSLKPCDGQSLAVVGTRQMTIYGASVAEKLSEELAGYGFTIVSGLARGIDTVAHKSALRRGRTIAVIGSGLGDIYPHENISLAEAICHNGALISEFPMMTPPDRQNFPQRNRIVSGMTLGTLLIEAPLKSGAMITMNKALAQKRRLFAVPGRIDIENSCGSHYLIKSGAAQLVENAKDITDNFQDLFAIRSPSGVKSKVGLHLESEEIDFLSKLPEQELSFDEILRLTQFSVTRLNVLIMSLILKKALKEFPGKVYKKLS